MYAALSLLCEGRKTDSSKSSAQVMQISKSGMNIHVMDLFTHDFYTDPI